MKELDVIPKSELGCELCDTVNVLRALGANDDTVHRCVLGRLVPGADAGENSMLLRGFTLGTPQS